MSRPKAKKLSIMPIYFGGYDLQLYRRSAPLLNMQPYSNPATYFKDSQIPAKNAKPEQISPTRHANVIVKWLHLLDQLIENHYEETCLTQLSLKQEDCQLSDSTYSFMDSIKSPNSPEFLYIQSQVTNTFKITHTNQSDNGFCFILEHLISFRRYLMWISCNQQPFLKIVHMQQQSKAFSEQGCSEFSYEQIWQKKKVIINKQKDKNSLQNRGTVVSDGFFQQVQEYIDAQKFVPILSKKGIHTESHTFFQDQKQAQELSSSLKQPLINKDLENQPQKKSKQNPIISMFEDCDCQSIENFSFKEDQSQKNSEKNNSPMIWARLSQSLHSAESQQQMLYSSVVERHQAGQTLLNLTSEIPKGQLKQHLRISAVYHYHVERKNGVRYPPSCDNSTAYNSDSNNKSCQKQKTHEHITRVLFRKKNIIKHFFNRKNESEVPFC